MFKKTKICSGLMLAFGGTLALSSLPAVGQQQLQRVEITGSSIKRINAETALPVTVITQEEIRKSGFTSAAELIQALPSMQGFVSASQSVNGGGGGATTASLHSLGSQYTLVLLNGRRLAPYNTGTTVNLSAIPLSAIERIEVLTDGASALYGADAIAGVVNFILKSNYSAGEVTLSGMGTQRGGGSTMNASITKGFGDLDKDKYNLLFSVSLDKQSQLNAVDRKFSETGFRKFTDNGRNLTTFFGSSNSIPGTVFLNDKVGDGTGDAAYSPDFFKTGACPPQHIFRGGFCRFDFSSTVQAIPDSDRASLFTSGRVKLSEAVTLFSEVVLSKYVTKPRFAPPAQPGIFLSQALVDKHVTPYLGQLGFGTNDYFPVGDPGFNGPTMNLRVFDAGGRQDEYRTDTKHLVLGAEGSSGVWDYSGYITRSENKSTDKAIGGYLSANAFDSIINSGAYDPLASRAGSAVAVLSPAVLRQVLDKTTSSLDVVSGRVNRTITPLGGGDLAVGVGFELGKQRFKDDPSAISQGANALQPNFTDSIIGGSGGALPFDSTRKTSGLFAELVAPITKTLEVSGALRYDKIGSVTNTKNFDSSGNPIAAETQGKSASDVTYKLSARFQPTAELLFRASYGTGFKAPSLKDITFPVQAFGSTGFYDCPPGLATALAAACKAGSSEYNLRQGGNPGTGAGGLSPEKSEQWTLGMRFEPSPVLSFGIDLWNVKLKDRIDSITERVAFSDGAKYGAAFSVLPDPVTGAPTLTYTQAFLNLGAAKYTGLDFDVSGKLKTGLGTLSSRAQVTYMIQSKYEIAGQDGFQSSLGGYGPDNEAVFRWLATVNTSLETGSFTNTLNFTFKPGYQDALATASSGSEIRVVNPNGSIGARVAVDRRVRPYTLVDWQIKYAVSKAFTVTGGIKNLFDSDPPFTLQNLDGTGNMRAYDARYADALGRQFYLSAGYRF